MSTNKNFDYNKAIEKEKLQTDSDNSSIQDGIMKVLQIVLGIIMAIIHA